MKIMNNRNKDRKICFYGRVSTEHEAQLAALENQMQWYDDQLRYHENWILTKKYIDKGITGTQAKKRPEFLQMLEDARKGEFDLIVTREVSRFARNTAEMLTITHELRVDHGVEVYFVEDNIWTFDGDGELRLSIMATLAQEESRKISERVKAGQFISQQNGTIYGNGNILGYDLVPGSKKKGTKPTYVINEAQAKTVRRIFDLYLSGVGLRLIANDLITGRYGRADGNVEWSASTVRRVLMNATYKGYMRYNQSFTKDYLEHKRVVNHNKEDHVLVKNPDIPVIIPEEEWDRAQSIMASKTAKRVVIEEDGTEKEVAVRGIRNSSDIWCQKLECKCGSKFSKIKWRINQNKTIRYGYDCQRKKNYGSKKKYEIAGLPVDKYCDMTSIADWKLEMMAKRIIEAIWTNRRETVIRAYELVIDNYEAEPSETKVHVASLDKEIQKIEDRILALTDMRADGELTAEEYREQKGLYLNKLGKLKEEREDVGAEYDEIEDLKSHLGALKECLDAAIDFSQEKLPDYVIDAFVRKVVPQGNNHFIWYLNLIDGIPEAVESEVEGKNTKKKRPTIRINGQEKNRPDMFHGRTGCDQRKEMKRLISIAAAQAAISDKK